MLATAGAAFGAASLSGADDHDPRSKEQAPSVIAIKAISADAHGLGHEAPEEGLVTGMVIDAETHAACATLVACCAAKCIRAHSAKSTPRASIRGRTAVLHQNTRKFESLEQLVAVNRNPPCR